MTEDKKIESFPCCICGEELPIDMTQILIDLGDGKYESCCCRHKGTKELKEYIKNHRKHA